MPQVKSPLSGSLGGSALVIGSCVLFGTTGTAQAFAPDGTEPAVLAAVRLSLAALVLSAYAWARGHLHRHMRWPPVMMLTLAVCSAALQVLILTAISLTGVAVGTLVALGTAPAVAGVLGFIVRGERPSRLWLLSTLGAVTGCALLLLNGSVSVDPAGIAWALAAGVAAAGQILSGKELLETHRPEPVLAVAFTLASLLLSPLLVLGNTSWLLEPRGLAVAFHMGVIVSGFAFVVYMRGLAIVTSTTGVTLGLTEPLVAAGLGVLVLNEHLTITGTIGALLVLASILGLALGPRLTMRPRVPRRPRVPVTARTASRAVWTRSVALVTPLSGSANRLYRRLRP